MIFLFSILIVKYFCFLLCWFLTFDWHCKINKFDLNQLYGVLQTLQLVKNCYFLGGKLLKRGLCSENTIASDLWSLFFHRGALHIPTLLTEQRVQITTRKSISNQRPLFEQALRPIHPIAPKRISSCISPQHLSTSQAPLDSAPGGARQQLIPCT